MQYPTNRFYAFLALLLTSTASLLAQAEGESPYSSSTVDTPEGSSFLDQSPLLIVGLLLVIMVVVLLVLKKKRTIR